MTTLATAASTYALDGAATAAGVTLVASGVLAGLGETTLVMLLVGTYLAWGVGLRASLAANWTLLTRTGASTNLLSKVAHDLAKARRCSVRRRRIAASTGYVATEVAKETLYYAGAGCVLLGNVASAGDALVFLAGTNIGAAAYEYGLARTTRVLLKRRSPGAGDALPRPDRVRETPGSNVK